MRVFLRLKSYISLIFIAIFLIVAIGVVPNSARAASFSISPSSGTHAIGSTFDVSVLVDTGGQSINAVQMQVFFPADRLQLVSPSAGQSIIGIYTSPPTFDNQKGFVEVIGGIPNGIDTKSGLITKLTFRVTGVGNASIRIGGDSQVLLNDGRGTNVLENNFGASFKLELPPQQGPIIISESHPDQDQWYRHNSVDLAWDIGLPPADGYSFTISDNPSDTPDNISDSKETKINYPKVQNGNSYFHIKSFRDGKWGGVSRYSLRIDTDPPAEFNIDISPNARTFVTTPFFQFATSDSLSGLDKYQLKIVPIKIDGRPLAKSDSQLFIDVITPYASPELLYGTYEVIIRAYDKAGNIREVSRKMEITSSWLWFLGQDGVQLPFGKELSWSMVWLVMGLWILLLLIVAFFVRRWYLGHHHKVINNHYPNNIKQQLEELQNYRAKYGKILSVLVVMILGWSTVLGTVQAQGINPPVIDSLSENIKTDELFYVSGRTPEPNTDVVVHVQSLVDGTSFDFNEHSDNRGDWIYRHSGFLDGGRYIIWAHTKNGEQLSAPSSQVTMDVKPVAISWGGSRITYQSLYIGVITALLLLVIGLLIYIIWHTVMVSRRRRQFTNQLRQVEDSIKRGFLALRRDVEGELNLIKQAHLTEGLSGEQKVRQEQLHQDLKNIEDLVGKEIWQVETYEHIPNR